MKIFRIKPITVLLLSLLSACASLTGVDPSSLKPTTKQNHLVIKQDYKWQEKFSVAQLTHDMTLKAGTYKAYLDDSSGTYYEGNGPCLEWKVTPYSWDHPSDIKTLKCGVYVPNAPRDRSIVYYYIDTAISQKVMDENDVGVIGRALDRAEWDNLKHLMYQPDAQELKSKIEISQ